jgi:hypothetical protein
MNMTTMTYKKFGETHQPIQTVQAKNAEIRIHADLIDSNILNIHPTCNYFSELSGFSLTNVSFDSGELVIKCDLHSCQLKLSTMDSIDMLWKQLNQAIVQAFDVPFQGFAEITIHLNETAIEEEHLFQVNELDCEPTLDGCKRINMTNRNSNNRKKRDIRPVKATDEFFESL